MGRITHIGFQPLDAEYENRKFDHFIREPAASASLVAGHGIRGDRKARPGGRQLNLLDTGWLARMAAAGFRTEPGAFGEQLIVDGIDLLTLKPGTRLRLGADAIIELHMPRDGCVRLQAAQHSSDPALLGHIGQLARVITGGEIHVGDPVAILEAR